MSFTVLQWNIWYKEKIENILETLMGIDADVVCLQELSIDNPEQSVKDSVAYIAEGLGSMFTLKLLL